jgi:hypothetical protein
VKIDDFFSELKRRNVYKVAITYAVVAWLLIQIATQVFPFFEIPNWTVRLVVLLVAIGFPISLIIAWAFELTPEGLKRTETVDAEHRPTRSRKRAWIYVVIIAAALSVGVFFLGRYTSSKQGAGAELSAKSIAVLPFDNLSRDPDNGLLCRRHPGRDPDTLIQDCRSEGDLAYIDAKVQERAGQSARNRKTAGRCEYPRGQRPKSC